MTIQRISWCVVLSVWLSSGPLVTAQYYRPGYAPGYPPPNPYGPGYPGMYPGYGGSVLSGRADVINSQGQFMQQIEQTKLMQEQVKQSKLDTQRKAFDQMMYEKANKLSYAEEKEIQKSNSVRRVLSTPTESEIKMGSAHNILLPYLQQLTSLGIQGPNVYLDQQQLKLINVTFSEQVDLGMLRVDRKLQWPPSLVGKTQSQLEPLLQQAVQGVLTSRLDPKLYKKVRATTELLGTELKQKFYDKEEIDTGEYIEGKRFLEGLNRSLTSLNHPRARELLDGTMRAVGNNVPELVMHLTTQGLKFAPSEAGDESGYFSVFNAMTAYANAAQSSNGFRTPVAPPTKLDGYRGK